MSFASCKQVEPEPAVSNEVETGYEVIGHFPGNEQA